MDKPQVPPDLWEQMDSVRVKVLTPEQPSGTFTVNQYADKYKMPYRTASDHLRRLLKAGEIETAGKSIRGKNFYRMVSK